MIQVSEIALVLPQKESSLDKTRVTATGGFKVKN